MTVKRTNKIFNSLLCWLTDVGRVFGNEFTVVRKDVGALIFFLLLPLAYPLVYTLIYNPEIVTDLPIAVVDDSRSKESRALVQAADASPAIKVYDYCANLSDAKKLFAENKVFGVMVIPSDYAVCINRGEQATVSFYSQMSLLLRYRAFVSALTDLQIEMVKDITTNRLHLLGATESELPIESNSHFLGVPTQGFASAVMPGILIMILQQSMVLGICLLVGTERERRRNNGGIDPLSINNTSALATTLGKALCYFMIYIPVSVYVLYIVPLIFDLPHIGDAIDIIIFMTPMLLASAMFGLTLGQFCRERESGFIMFVFTSVIFLFLSGLTWPRYAMNDLFIWMGNIVPGTWGVNGFILINTNAAKISDVGHDYIVLWILTIAYFVAATLLYNRLKKAENYHNKA